MRQIYTASASICITAMTAFMLSGCATIFQGTQQDVSFDSVPKGAKIYLDGKEVAVTPCTLTITRNHEYILQIKAKGFETRTYLIGNSQSNESKTYKIGSSVGAGWIVLDVVPGLIAEVVALASGSSAGTSQLIAVSCMVGATVVDASTGAWSSLNQSQINAVLSKEAESK